MITRDAVFNFRIVVRTVLVLFPCVVEYFAFLPGPASQPQRSPETRPRGRAPVSLRVSFFPSLLFTPRVIVDRRRSPSHEEPHAQSFRTARPSEADGPGRDVRSSSPRTPAVPAATDACRRPVGASCWARTAPQPQQKACLPAKDDTSPAAHHAACLTPVPAEACSGASAVARPSSSITRLPTAVKSHAFSRREPLRGATFCDQPRRARRRNRCEICPSSTIPAAAADLTIARPRCTAIALSTSVVRRVTGIAGSDRELGPLHGHRCCGRPL